jgi:hypothetical protein
MSRILGGLLQGLSSGLAIQAQQMREDSLNALRRQDALAAEARQDQRTLDAENRGEQRMIRAEGREDDRTVASEQRNAVLKTGLLALQHEYDMTELEVRQRFSLEEIAARGDQDRETATHKGGIDRSLATWKANLDRRNDAASQKLRDKLDSDDVDRIITAEDGEAIIVYKNGDREKTGVKQREQSSGGYPSLLGTPPAQEQAPAPAPSPTPTFNANDRPVRIDTPEAKRQIESAASRLMSSGELGKGTRVGETVTAPAGVLAGKPVTLRWNGNRWEFVPG